MRLTIRQVQERTGLSTTAIRNHIKSGTINVQREKKSYFVEESELTKLPLSRSVRPQPVQKEEVPTQEPPFSLEEQREKTKQIAIQGILAILGLQKADAA